MIIDFFKKFELPYWLELWVWINIVIVIIYSCSYMLYTDGQVTIKFLEDKYHFNQSIQLSNDSPINLTIVDFSIPAQDDFFYQLKRVYNDEIDKSRKIRMFNYVIWYLIIPLFNIIYGCLVIVDNFIFNQKIYI